MEYPPDRGSIIIVNFELQGVALLPEMRKTNRPCVVVQNNKLERGQLVTIVPLSTSSPEPPEKQHHQMHHLSFRDWPIEWDAQGLPRWAKCDYIATVSLARCTLPYRKLRFEGRRYIKVKAIKADIEAIDRCVLWALGIDPAKYGPIPEQPAAAGPPAG